MESKQKHHKQEKVSFRKEEEFKVELKAEEGEESPMTSWVKAKGLKKSTRQERTENSAIWLMGKWERGELKPCQRSYWPWSRIWVLFRIYQISS